MNNQGSLFFSDSPEPKYNPSFDVNEQFVYNGAYITVLDRRVASDGSVEYQLPLKGKLQWKDAALIDRESTAL